MKIKRGGRKSTSHTAGSSAFRACFIQQREPVLMTGGENYSQADDEPCRYKLLRIPGAEGGLLLRDTRDD